MFTQNNQKVVLYIFIMNQLLIVILDANALVADCKSCLATLSQSDYPTIPRVEIQEACAIALINLCEWDTLMGMDRRIVFFELASALANACQDIVKFKGAKMISRDSWNLSEFYNK